MRSQKYNTTSAQKRWEVKQYTVKLHTECKNSLGFWKNRKYTKFVTVRRARLIFFWGDKIKNPKVWLTYLGKPSFKKTAFIWKVFTNGGGGGQSVFKLLFRNLKTQNGMVWARIECLDVSDNSVIGWFLASILLKIWILNDLRCFVAFWFCRKIYGKISE